MKNKFYVTLCRFHTKEENKLLIAGWFHQNEMGENQLLVCLDKKKIPFSIEEIDMGRSTIRSSDGIVITKQYFLWVTLPKKWGGCRHLQVKNFYKGVGKTAFDASIPKLKKIKKQQQVYIDNGIAGIDGFKISG